MNRSADDVRPVAAAAPKKRDGNDTVETYSTALTLSNTMVGAALLSLSYTIVRIGWGMGLVLMAFAFTYSLFGFYAVIDAAHYTQSRTLRGCVTAVFGPIPAMVMDVCIVLMYTGLLVVYVSICGDYIGACITGFSYGRASFDIRYTKLILGGLLLPLTLLRSVKALSNISGFCIIFIFVSVLSITVYFFIGLGKRKVACNVAGLQIDEPFTGSTCDLDANTCTWEPFPSPMYIVGPAHTVAWKAFLEIVRRVSVFMPLFGCHASIAPLLHELKGTPIRRWKILRKAITIAAATTGALYLISGFGSSLMFNRYIQANVLLSFLPTEIYMTVVRLLYTLVMALSYVVILFPIRVIIMSWWSLSNETKKGKVVFVCIGIILMIVSVTLSIFVPSIDTVFNAISALFGIAVYWLVPLLLRWKLPFIQATSPLAFPDEVQDEAEDDTVAVGAFAMFGLNVNYARTMSKVLSRDHALQSRLRTRSELRQNQNDIAARGRAATLAVPKGSRDPLLTPSNPPLVTENLRSEPPITDRNTILTQQRNRTISIADSHPTKPFDLTDDANSPDRKAPPPGVTADLLIMQQVVDEFRAEQAEQATRPETVAIPIEEQEIDMTDPRRVLLLKKMTKLRFGGFMAATTIICIINLTAFFLSTFVDTNTFTFNI
ncbi:Solute carrier family protein [Giardia muris]|uniref:Solute carrier family protein n=1 Tax=Giardia muris TaxID=5742 RepID=A0A4Z1SYX3_GIAMU|nr:Solute carrier family protein [Giardia muris]|eukprot:TNJ30670.1 Solute carrier family protein [Giardia muris]